MAPARGAPHDAAALVRFDDARLFFFSHLHHVERGAAAVATLVGLQRALFDSQMRGKRLTARRSRRKFAIDTEPEFIEATQRLRAPISGAKVAGWSLLVRAQLK